MFCKYLSKQQDHPYRYLFGQFCYSEFRICRPSSEADGKEYHPFDYRFRILMFTWMFTSVKRLKIVYK